jgi:hypothetical protein
LFDFLKIFGVTLVVLGLPNQALAVINCPDALNNCTVNGETHVLGGVHVFNEVRVQNNGVIQVPDYNGVDPINTGNLQIRANYIRVSGSAAIRADGAGYQGLVCGDGPGPNALAGGRGGCSVRDSGGGGAHFGNGGRGTKDCFIIAPSNSCQFPAEWEEALGTRQNGWCSHPGTFAWTWDGLPTVAGQSYRHSIYQVEFGAAGGDMGCGDGGWFNTGSNAMSGAGGGRIVLAGVNDGQTGQVIIRGEVTADGWRGCGRGNDSAGGGAGGSVLIAGDEVEIGWIGRVSAEGGIGGDTQMNAYKNQSCPSGAQSSGTCDDCGGGGGGGVVSILSGAPAEINDSADFNVQGAVGGSCVICSGEAGGGAGELQIAGVFTGEFCDGFDNDFDGLVDEDLGSVTCGSPGCTTTVPACTGGVANACVPPSTPACQNLSTDNRPRILVIVDTSGSMLLDANGLPTFGDGSVEHPGLGSPSRLFLAKEALTQVLAGYPEIDYGLARFAQENGANINCQQASWLECGGVCCSYDLPTNNTGATSCTVQVSPGQTVSVLTSPGPDDEECINYSGSCGSPGQGADILVGFEAGVHQKLMWMDHAEVNFINTTESGNYCSFGAGGDCELRATGPTPLAGALSSAQNYLAQVRATDPIADCRTYAVILLTDGAETCLGNPSAAAGNLLSSEDVETYVVGFTILDEEKSLLNGVANAGSSTGVRPAYFADNQSELAQALAEIVTSAFNFESCNGTDDNCNCPGDTNGDSVVCGPGDVGVDEAFPLVGTPCDDGQQGICAASGVFDCNGAGNGVLCQITNPGSGATLEICGDGLDNDCDGAIDEGCTTTLDLCNGLDDDSNPTTPDGFHDPAVGQPCGTEEGICTSGISACVDGALECTGGVQPIEEQCDGLDNNCDGVTDGLAGTCYEYPVGCEADGSSCQGLCAPGTRVCAANPAVFEGWGPCYGQSPPQDEQCDGLDNNCDGAIDDGMEVVSCYPPGDGPTTGCSFDEESQSWTCQGNCQTGTRGCSLGLLGICDGFVGPAAEGCDGLDNDCDGLTDEELVISCASACGVGTKECLNGSWLDCIAPPPSLDYCDGFDNDCDGKIDNNPDGSPIQQDCDTACGTGFEICLGGGYVNCTAPPELPEACDQLDNDCDGAIDEDLVRPCFSTCGTGTQACDEGMWSECSIEVGPETCDNIDNDCDGVTDLLVEKCTTVCGDGVRFCQSGDWVPCSAGTPSLEICDGYDNDCDGETDEIQEATCPNETLQCARGECREICPTTSECVGEAQVCIDGVCLPDPCGDGSSGGVPDWDTWTCVDPECIGADCPEGSVCVAGYCVDPGDCYAFSCLEGEVCMAGYCIPDPCSVAGCAAGQMCDKGACFDSCQDLMCPSGQTCYRGVCSEDSCAEVLCPQDWLCFEGECQPDVCSGSGCPQGYECLGGQCRPDPCTAVHCPDEQTCVDGSCGLQAEPLVEPPPEFEVELDASGSEALPTYYEPLSGCSCRTMARTPPMPSGVWLLSLTALGLYLLRRRRTLGPRSLR